MREWTLPDHHPLFIASGEGPWLRDAAGNRYLDGNSSIWTNIHGHNHPRINRAITEQLFQIAHSSFLGLTHLPAARLAKELVDLLPDSGITRVFYSDDGSTGIEVAIKMAIQYFKQTGLSKKIGFAAFNNAYHGDTLGASSLGGIANFHDRFAALQFPVMRVNGLDELDRLDAATLAAIVIEPLIQGAAGMRTWPAGMLRQLRQWCDRHHVLLVFDEVMTGFGRTGRMFACQHEGVIPDFLVLAKGLTGGYLPLAATLTTEAIYDGFLGDFSELRAFFYGHSYTANPLGCAAALASLQVFREERVLEHVASVIPVLEEGLEQLKQLPCVRDVRQIGMIAGIEVGAADGITFDWRERMGAKVCVAARDFGLLTRPIQDVVVFMPPLCVSRDEIRFGIEVIGKAVKTVCG
ncbi:MAG: adenosylmethionine--8-amino-7-oxononanoate transaminase [Verrucomicrobia bacterium]|nr:adenosylmethionine--8-amino-7-oxononanoate transaminase [Verrucomicrobiota bacterium]MBV8482535.1 adenosylmethionine--8-amino-7-oxononanoate transaminase [Verrucomicrobiota bacterium]